MFKALDRFLQRRSAFHYILTALWIFFAIYAFIHHQWFSFWINVILLVAFNYRGIRRWVLTKTKKGKKNNNDYSHYGSGSYWKSQNPWNK